MNSVECLQLFAPTPGPQRRIRFTLTCGDTVHTFSSAQTLKDIVEFAGEMIGRLNAEMIEWCKGQSHRANDRFEDMMRQEGAELSARLLGQTGTHLLANYRGVAPVLSVLCKSTEVLDLPWSLAFVDGEGDEGKAGFGGHLLGQAYLVARPNPKSKLPGVQAASIVPAHAVRIVHPAASEGLAPQVVCDAQHFATLSQLSEYVSDKHVVIIVCKSGTDKSSKTRLKLGLRLLQSDLLYTRESARVFPFRREALVVLMACEGACEEVAGAIANHSRCTVIGCQVVLPPDMGVVWAQHWWDNLTVESVNKDLCDAWAKWTQSVGMMSGLFRVHGRWRIKIGG